MIDRILEYENFLCEEKNIISNIDQAKFWKSLPNPSNDIILPLYIFCDDIEVGNPLGSRAGVLKFTSIYACIGCLPPDIASRVDSIIFSRIFRTKEKIWFQKKLLFKI